MPRIRSLLAKEAREASARPSFVVDLAAHEIRRDGVVRPVQPKVFDLLAHLMANHHRVVTRSELLSEFWPGVVVNHNVVARAVMKAREAIGDSQYLSHVIKTVHRVGYRYVGIAAPDVDGSANAPNAVAFAHSPASGPDSRPVGVCVMPIDNRLSMKQFGWVPLGLASLIAQAFDRDTRFAVVTVLTMLQTLGRLSAEATPSRRALTLVDMLGTDCIVHGSVDQEGDLFVLTYRGHGRLGHGLGGRLEGTELTSLGQALATAVERHLFPTATNRVRFESIDPLANQTFARALQATTDQNYVFARKLIDVVLDIEPRNSSALLLKLQVIGNMLGSEAEAVGEQVLQKAAMNGDSVFLTQVHTAIAFGSLGRNGPTPFTRHHATAALALCGEGRSDAVSLRAYEMGAVVEQARGNDAGARVLANHCLAEHARSGDRYAFARAQAILAYSNLRVREYGDARSRLEDSFAFFSAHGFQQTALFVLSNLAGLVNAPCGLWVRALQQCDQAFVLIKALGGLPNAIFPLATLSGVLAEFSRAGSVEAAVDLLKLPPSEDTPHLQAAYLTVQAHVAIAKGDFEAAREPLRRALELHRSLFAAANIRFSASRLLRNEMRAGRFTEAVATANNLLRHEPSLHDDAEIDGLRLHATAANWHEKGDREGALAGLARAIARLPAGEAGARARIDAAWLALELHRLAEAHSWLADIPDWLTEHPLGMAVHGRRLWAEGRRQDALGALDACLAGLSTAPPWLLALQKFFVDAPNGEAVKPPLLSRLPTTLWPQ